jgi:hypothetical protein
MLAAAFLLAGAAPAIGQDPVELLERFSVVLGGSWVEADSAIRLDSEGLDLGTEIDFEDDLGFDDSEVLPSLGLELQLGRRHRLMASWQDLDRESSTRIVRDIEFGDEVFPIDVEVAASFDVIDYRLGYSYWPIRKDRTAFGVGLGVRVLDISVGLEVEELELVEEREVTGPLPFLDLQLRQALGSRLRLLAELGVLAVEVDNLSGEQLLARIGIEHMTFQSFSFGGAFALSNVDTDVEERGFHGEVVLDFWEATAFARYRL